RLGAVPVARPPALLPLVGEPVHAGGAELQRHRAGRVVLVPGGRRLPRTAPRRRERPPPGRGRGRGGPPQSAGQSRSGLAEVLRRGGGRACVSTRRPGRVRLSPPP